MPAIVLPARYYPHVEEVLRRLQQEIARDIGCRADEDARVQALAEVPNPLVDPSLEGSLLIMLTVPNELARDDALPTHLLSLTAITR